VCRRETALIPTKAASPSARAGRGTRILKSGLETARTKLGKVFAIEEETWTDSRLRFRARALAKSRMARSTSPKIAHGWKRRSRGRWEKIQHAVQSQGRTLLEKK
jgi:hypothetical protein